MWVRATLALVLTGVVGCTSGDNGQGNADAAQDEEVSCLEGFYQYNDRVSELVAAHASGCGADADCVSAGPTALECEGESTVMYGTCPDAIAQGQQEAFASALQELQQEFCDRSLGSCGASPVCPPLGDPVCIAGTCQLEAVDGGAGDGG